MSDDEDREARAFREAMRDVRRLTRGGKAERAVPKPPAKARFTRADQVEVLRESLQQPPDEAVLAARFSNPRELADLYLQPADQGGEPVRVPMVSAPFIWNFMLPVPDASKPAVEICSLRSAAGMMLSASETR